MSSFTRPLYVEYIGNSLFRVDKAFEYHIGKEGSGQVIPVPKSYVTDLASIPWFARWLIDRNGNHNQPAVGHDLLYTIMRIIWYITKRGGSVHLEDYVKFSVDGPKVYLKDYLPFRNRKQCDDLFLEMMNVVNESPYTKIPAWQRRVMYRAVRIGGGWNMREKAVFKRVHSYSIAHLRESTTHS